MRIALAQLDTRLGEVEGNESRVHETLAATDADLVVFPELFLSGYAPGELGPQTARRVEDVARLAAPDGPAALVGFHERGGLNSAAYVDAGAVVHLHRKLYLVDYAPFDEDVVFTRGDELRAFDTEDGRFATLICNDAWHPVVPFLAAQDGASVLLLPSASSTVVPEAEQAWRELTRFYARMLQCYVVFTNRAGTDPGFTFWGGSHIVDPWGEVVVEAPRFEEAVVSAEVDLAAVGERRSELPLFREPRLDLLCNELTRLRDERRMSLKFQVSGGKTGVRASDK